jgi:hypothetical protein
MKTFKVFHPEPQEAKRNGFSTRPHGLLVSSGQIFGHVVFVERSWSFEKEPIGVGGDGCWRIMAFKCNSEVTQRNGVACYRIMALKVPFGEKRRDLRDIG